MEDVRQGAVDSEVAALKNIGAFVLVHYVLLDCLGKRSRVGGRKT